MRKAALFLVCFLVLVSIGLGYCAAPKEIWKDISSGIDEVDLRTVCVDPNNPDIIYAGSTKSIFKTSDNGKSWQKLYMIRGTFTSVNTIAIDPKNIGIIYAGTQSGLYKSTDGGLGWNKIFEGIAGQQKDIRHITIESVDTKKIYIGTNNGISITQDAGATWSKLNNEIANQIVNFVTLDPVSPDVIYAAAKTGVFKSKDGGISFERQFTAVAQTSEAEPNEISEDTNLDDLATYSNKIPNCVVVDTKDNNKIYIGTNSGVFISYDAGETWEKLTSSGLINNKVTSLVSTKDGWLYAATKNGIFRISSPYQNWAEIYSGLLSKDARYLAYDLKNNLILAATEKGIYQLHNNPGPNVNSKEKSITPDEDITEVLAKFKSEPGIREIQEVAIKYAEVNKEKIDRWRKGAKQKALLPKVSVGIDESKGDYYYSGTWKGKDGTTGWDVSLTWDFGELVWNDDQTSIDVRSRLMVQLRDDILDEITRLYFERRKLQIELLTNAPKNLQSKLEKELRLQELTAGIDALTGGWFSKRILEAGH